MSIYAVEYSSLFGKTYREVPHGLRARSQILLVQGGYVRPLGRGLFSHLPLGVRVLQKLKTLIREEMDRIGGQEVSVPLVNPYEIWKQGGREGLINRGMIRFKDRTGRELVLAPSHEEAMVDLVKKSLKSYRDLPIFLYQFQEKYRDESNPRSGLIRAQEFMMKDGYSFHRTYHELNNFFPKAFGAYERIFSRCELPIVSAESGVGFMGGDKAYEFHLPMESGDNIVVVCDACGYKANREIAKAIKELGDDEPLPIKEVGTKDCISMKRLAKHLELPLSKLAKPIVFGSKDRFVMAVIRADFDICYEKLAGLLREPGLHLASNGELAELDLMRGFMSPIGRDDLVIVVDDSVAHTANLVYGSNSRDRHLINVNYGRDYSADLVGDISQVGAGHRCLQCHAPLRELKTMELGNIFKLSDFYSRAMDLHFQDYGGNVVYPQMGSYGIGMGRLLSAIVECHHDDRGIVWPPFLAPFKAFLMGIGRSLAVKRVLEKLHNDMPSDILVDDRHESPGVKFKDADLIGIPLRILVTGQLLESGKAEVYERKTRKTTLVDIDKVPAIIRDIS